MPAKRRTSAAAALIAHLRELGLRRYPGAHEKSPWPGHRDLAVNDKTFAYLSAPGDPCGLSLKLPFSRSLALDLPGAEPTEYGLGKSGWVSLRFDDDDALPPTELLESWLDESYRAQAPKKLLAKFESGGFASGASDSSVMEMKPAGRARPAARKARGKRR
jgi:predicted DNA-binding protein (MmcQ/YjbR family)